MNHTRSSAEKNKSINSEISFSARALSLSFSLPLSFQSLSCTYTNIHTYTHKHTHTHTHTRANQVHSHSYARPHSLFRVHFAVAVSPHRRLQNRSRLGDPFRFPARLSKFIYLFASCKIARRESLNT